jgi:histone H3/H4
MAKPEMDDPGIDRLKTLLREAGIPGLSNEAIHGLRHVLQDHALYVARSAAEIARHAGRTEILEGDIKLASGPTAIGSVKNPKGVLI